MAKRLNKKVALIGSVIFVLLVLAVLGVVLYLSRDPSKFIEDGDAAMLAADYETAEENYRQAIDLAKDDSLRVELLFKLGEVFHETDEWRDILGCWNGIIRIEPSNIKARLGRLDYIYIMADSGAIRVWPEVLTQASEFLEVADDEVLAAEAGQWESFDGMGGEPRPEGMKLGTYLYMAKGRANLETARSGAVTEPEKLFDSAIADMEKLIELSPDNVDAYYYLAEAFLAKGEIGYSRGILTERDRAADKTIELLNKAVETDPDNPKAQINLLRAKPAVLRMQSRAQIEALESEYLSLAENFASSGEVFAELAGYYSRFGVNKLDSAIEAVEKAIALDSEEVSYHLLLTDLLYRRYAFTGRQADIERAMEVVRAAFELPDTHDQAGPRDFANRMNRAALYTSIATCCVDQILAIEPDDKTKEAEKQKWLTETEEAVHQIEQIYGSGEEPQVIKWRGMLDLARGNREDAIRKLYAVYEQFASAGRSDGRLSYALAQTMKEAPEVGAVVEFLTSALNANIGYSRPSAHLDYAEILLELGVWDVIISNMDAYEDNFDPDYRSKTIRLRAYIGANLFDEAEEALAASGFDEADKIKFNIMLAGARVARLQRDLLQKTASEGVIAEMTGTDQGSDESLKTELSRYRDELAQWVEKQLAVEPDEVEDNVFSILGQSYVLAGDFEKGRDVVIRFLKYAPENVSLRYYNEVFSGPDPANISQDRQREIEEKTMLGFSDPVRRAMNLGRFYQRYNEFAKAAEQYKTVFDPDAPPETVVAAVKSDNETLAEASRAAANFLFDIALANEDWQRAEKIMETARVANLDQCEGRFFAARVAIARENYDQALLSLDECLRQRPLFSYGYMLRSNVNRSLGNEDASITDARRAASLNPTDGNIAKVFVNALYNRDERLGERATIEQLNETRSALERAFSLNPRDVEVISSYAQYISSTDPLRALAIRQNLQRTSPSLENAMMLGALATQIASGETDPKRKEALFDIAGASFEQARQMDPYDRGMLYNYSQYYRARGMEEKAREVLEQSQDNKLLWTHYYQLGQFDKAVEILKELYSSSPSDIEIIKGLLLLSDQTADAEGVKRYSDELLRLEDTVEYRLLQIQLFLKVGLLQEAEQKLQSFNERYPGEAQAMLLESLLYTKQGQVQKALDLANRALAADQENPSAWQLRGEINLLMANYTQAIIDLTRSQTYRDEPAVRISLAKAYINARREDDAIVELRSVIDDPQVFMEARLLLEQIYKQPNRKDSLNGFYDEMLSKTSDSLFWSNRAGAFALEEKDFNRAEKMYSRTWQKSIDQGQANAEAFDGYLQALLSGGKFDKVLSEAGKYVDGDVGFVAFLGMAEAKLKLNDRPTAVQYCRKAIDKAAGTDIWEIWTLEKMYLLLGADEVLKYCDEKLRSNPDSLAANYAMYNLAMLNTEYNKALNYLDKCIGIIGPSNSRAITYSVKKADTLQQAYNKTSDKNYIQKAVAEYESLMKKLPNSMSVLNNLAFMLAENDERPGDALEYAKKAYEAAPNNPAFMETYSYVLYKNGEYPRALELIRASLQQYQAQRIDVPAELYEHMGMINEKLGSGAEALAAYEQALRITNASGSTTAAERIKAAIERLPK